MLNLKKIAITGCIGAGKSTVCTYLKKKNFYIVDADTVSHSLLTFPSKIGQEIIDLLGDEIIVKGRFDRKKIASKVFTSKSKLKNLENILHPKILEEIESQYEQVKKKNYSYFAADIALLFEMGHETFYDYIIMIDAKKSYCKKRFQEKGYSFEDFDLRMVNQLPIDEKIKRSHFVIHNNSSIQDLKDQVDETIHKIDLKQSRTYGRK